MFDPSRKAGAIQNGWGLFEWRSLRQIIYRIREGLITHFVNFLVRPFFYTVRRATSWSHSRRPGFPSGQSFRIGMLKIFRPAFPLNASVMTTPLLAKKSYTAERGGSG